MVEALTVLETLVLAQAGIFERALLETVAFHEIGFVLSS